MKKLNNLKYPQKVKPVDNQPPVLDPVEPFFTVEEVFYGTQQFQAATSSLSQSCNPAKYCQKPLVVLEIFSGCSKNYLVAVALLSGKPLNIKTLKFSC